MALCGCLAGGPASGPIPVYGPTAATADAGGPVALAAGRPAMPRRLRRAPSVSIRANAEPARPDARGRVEAVFDRAARRSPGTLSPHQGERAVHGAGQGLPRPRLREDGPGPLQGAAEGIPPAGLHPALQGIPHEELHPGYAGAGPEHDHEVRDQAARAGPDPRRGRGPGGEREDPRRRPRSCSTRSRSCTPSASRGCRRCSSGAKGRAGPGDPDHQPVRPGPVALSQGAGPAGGPDELRA